MEVKKIHKNIFLLFTIISFATMSACGTVDTSNLASSEAILEQSSVSSTEQANSSAESEAPSSQTGISISFQKHSIYSKYSFNEYEMYIHVMRGCWLWQDLISLDHVNYGVK